VQRFDEVHCVQAGLTEVKVYNGVELTVFEEDVVFVEVAVVRQSRAGVPGSIVAIRKGGKTRRERLDGLQILRLR
jgi:hypothetical protein